MTNEPLVTMMPDTGTSPLQSSSILNKDGYACSLMTLTGSDELPLAEQSHEKHNHVVFVIEGSLNVRMGKINVVLNKDEAVFVPSEEQAVIRNLQVPRSKFLRTDVALPPPPPPLVTLPKRT